MVLPRPELLQWAQNSRVTQGESLTIFTTDGWVWCRVDPLGRGVLRKPAQQRTSIQPRRSYCPRALHCGSLGVSAAVPLISRYMGPAARYDDFEAVAGVPGFWLLIAQILWGFCGLTLCFASQVPLLRPLKFLQSFCRNP